jgi:hypothetical protein
VSAVAQAAPVEPEILRLARLLRCPPERLSYLAKVPPEDLRVLREQVVEMLWGAHNQTLEKLAAASKLLPIALVAAIAERAFGPILAARMAGLIEPSRAVEVAVRVPVAFLADIAAEIDPRRTKQVIDGIPAERIAQLTRLLADRQEFVPMGSAVGQLPVATLRAALEVLDDAELLRAAYLMEDKQRLPELAELLGHDRLIGMIDVAQRAGLEYEAVDLLSHLDDTQRSEILEVLHQRDETAHAEVLEQLSSSGR